MRSQIRLNTQITRGKGHHPEEPTAPTPTDLPPTEPGEDFLPDSGPKNPPEEEIVATQKTSSTNKKSNRDRYLSERLIEAMTTDIKAKTSHDVEGEIFCLSAMFLKEDPIGQEYPLLSYKASADPDTLNMNELMKDPDRKYFIAAMQKKVTEQT